MNEIANVNDSPLVQQAEMLAKSDLVPKRFRGKVNNVLAMIQLADRCGMEPISLMQSAYEVGGEYALDTKAAIAMLAASGRVIGPPRYTIEGKDLKTSSCTCTVRDAQLNEDISLTFHYSTAEKQGWSKNPHWRNDPRTMMRYRSAVQLIRSSYPDVLMGMYTIDEMRDRQTVEGSVVRSAATRQITHSNTDLLDAVAEDAASEPEAASEPTPEEQAEILAAEAGELFEKGQSRVEYE